MNVLVMAVAVSGSSERLRPTIPPKADSGSTSRALTYASASVAAVATPHGFVCFITTAAGVENEFFIYDGTQHAFCNDDRPEVYDEIAAKTSMDRTVEFMTQHLS